jgi:ABC-type proline/glycine betaine transport system permease subunit
MTCAVISVLSMLVGIVIGIPIGIELARGHGHRGGKP